MRLFLGLPWPAEAVPGLVARAKVWEGRDGLRPVRPDNWHVTLRFLAEIPEDKVPELTKKLAD